MCGPLHLFLALGLVEIVAGDALNLLPQATGVGLLSGWSYQPRELLRLRAPQPLQPAQPAQPPQPFLSQVAFLE